MTHTGILEGVDARRFAERYYESRTWSRWQRVLWWLALHAWRVKVIFARSDPSSPYLLRATLLPRTPFSWPVYLHYGFRRDDELEQHNHPWDALSLILSEGYLEERGCRAVRYRRAGQFVDIRRDTFHRILSSGWFSLFVPRKRVQDWGFRDPETHRYWDHDNYIALKRGNVPRASKAPRA